MSAYEIHIQKVVNADPSIYGSWAREHVDCLRISYITLPGIKICQLIMVSACAAFPWPFTWVLAPNTL